jgi:predicted nucleotidyltransferase
MKTLFETVVGSHLWGMEHEGSDVDIFRCVLMDTDSYLKGSMMKNLNYTEYGKLDMQVMELGHLIDLMVENNYNAILYVMSPHVRFFNGDALEKLRSILSDGLSKEVYNSINGLGISNFKKYISSGLDTSEHRCNIICRSLQFGINLLNEKTIRFAKFEGGSPARVEALLFDIKKAYEQSTLPERVSGEVKQRYSELLLQKRLEYLKEIS